MTATNHALTGALLGALLPLPLALPAAFASHFLLDILPHYGIPHTHRNGSRTYQLIVFGDTIIGLALLVVALLLHKWRMTITGLVAYSPDLLWVVYYFRHARNLHLQPKNTFMRFHMHIQQYERAWGIAVDVIVMAALFPLVIHQLLK